MIVYEPVNDMYGRIGRERIYNTIHTNVLYDESEADAKLWQEAISTPQYSNEVEEDIKGLTLR